MGGVTSFGESARARRKNVPREITAPAGEGGDEDGFVFGGGEEERTFAG